MTCFVPSYYTAFSCIADACQHSCCIGWEIGIDAVSKERYAQYNTPLGDTLHAWMRTDEYGNTYMALTDSGRCPMLTETGLCRLILEVGEGALCQICADHPRFRSYFSDRIEMGLGACCEAAARLILSQSEAVRPLPLGDEEPLHPTTDEAAFFAARDALIAIAQDRSLSIDERLDTILTAVNKQRPPLSRRALFGIYSSLERLDPAWDDVLARLLDADDPIPVAHVFCEQWLVYGLWRHTAGSLQDGRFPSRVAMVVHSVRLIQALCRDASLGSVADLIRAYSAEVEYSEDNVEQLLDTF